MILAEKKKKPYKLGLALSGGGAKGFAHIGVFEKLEELGVRPDIIAGTSAGSIAGVLYADGKKPDEIKKLFTGKEFSEFAQIKFPKDGFFDMHKMQHFLEKSLKAKTFEELQTPMIVVATDLDHGKSHLFNKGPIIRPVIASSSVPIVFCPQEIDGVRYVDGGLFRNFPVTPLKELCEYVIGVNVSPLTPREYKPTILHIAERSYHYIFSANALIDRELCDLLIETHKFDDFKMFDLENVDMIAKIGYNTATEAIDKLIKENKKKRLVYMLQNGHPRKVPSV